MTDAESQKKRTEWDFPEVELTDAQRTWLEAVYRHFREGKEIVPRLLKHDLRDQLPSDFDPDEIDRRLLTGKTDPTLLGVWHVDPDSEIITLLDRLLRRVRDRARTEVEVGSIDLRELAEQWDVTLRDLSSAYEIMPPGYTSGASASPDTGDDKRSMYTSIRVTGEKVLERCAEFGGLEERVRNDFESQNSKGQPTRSPPDAAFPIGKTEPAEYDARFKDVADEVGVNFVLITINSVGRFFTKLWAWLKRD